MIIKTLAELQQPDEASLYSTPWGASGRTRPEDAALYLQYSVSRLELSEQVPESTRKSFERLRTLYAYGILCYDLYTVAGDLARLVIEQALRERFLPFYNETVSFVHDLDGSERVISARNWDEFQAALPPSRQWRLRLRSGHEPIRFNGMLTSLLRWARAEGLLAGQGDRMRDEPRAWFRNYVAHPSYHLDDPGHAGWAIADLAQVINRLWGAPSGMQVRREPMVIAWSADTVTWNTAASFTPIPGAGDLTCVIVLADPEDPGLADYDALYESTYRPCDWLWGPGNWAGAQAWLEDRRPAGDEAETIDRLFLLRYEDPMLYLPRSPAVAAALTPGDRDGTWYLIRADYPFAAFSHQRQVLAEVPGHAAAGDCKACPVQTIAAGDIDAVLGKCEELGADVMPREVPDVRTTMSQMPRRNRIVGNGAWEILRD
jgi:hypothetical protein